MAISRPFLLAALGVILLGATALAVQNARDTTDNPSTPALVQSDATPAPAQQPASTDVADTFKAAFDLSDVERARVDIALSIRGRGAVALNLAGAFDRSDTDASRFAIGGRLAIHTGSAVGNGAVSGRLVSLGDKAYFVRGDDGWRVPAVVWRPVTAGKFPLSIHPSTWVRDLKSEGTESVRGVQTEHISGRIDPQAFLHDLGPLLGSGGAQIGRPKRAEFDVWVGKKDHVMRRATVDLVFPHRAHTQADVRLSDINEPQPIRVPKHVHAGAPSGSLGLFGAFAVAQVNNVTGNSTPSLQALASPNPGRAARAVRQHKKVVILFRNDRGLDDRAMASVVRSVDRRTQAVVLSDPVDAVDRYGKLLQDLGVNETPSVVIIDSRGRAKLIEGYVDSDTLTQAVADAR
jgi:hypothetical protein